MSWTTSPSGWIGIIMFLHFYEPVLDRKTKRFIERYELDDYRAEDLKQIFSFLLWKELQSYKSELPLLQLVKYKVQTKWQEYVRVNCGNYQVDKRHQYLLLKRIAYLYYRKKDNNSLSEIITEIAAELNLTEESVENYLVAVSTFKPKYNADFYANDDEDDFYSSAVDSVANHLDTEALYFKLLRQEKLNSALADLRKPDRLLIEYVYGICPKCLKNREKKTLREASLLLGLTEDSAEKKLKNILNKLKKEHGRVKAADVVLRSLFAAHKPRQIACVGFVGRGRVRYPTDSFARHGANRNRQIRNRIATSSALMQ